MNPALEQPLTVGDDVSEAVNVASHNGAGPLIAVCRTLTRQGSGSERKMRVKIPSLDRGDSGLHVRLTSSGGLSTPTKTRTEIVRLTAAFAGG